MVDKLPALARDLPAAEIVADFTGRTKSMSAALTLAALDAGAALQLVTGDRPDLVRVRDRTEQAIAVRTKRIAGAPEFERLASGWSRYAYQEAAEGFARLWTDMKTEGLSREELRTLTRAKELSQAFAAWDSFDHKGAFGCRLPPPSTERALYLRRAISRRREARKKHWRGARSRSMVAMQKRTPALLLRSTGAAIIKGGRPKPSEPWQ